jgi:hypothetical protein
MINYCAHNWFQNDPHNIGRNVLDARVTVTTGDQLKTDDLLQAITTLGPQDVIIDDGGHTNMMQQTSLRVLLPYVRPGGIYILRRFANELLFGEVETTLTELQWLTTSLK